LNDTARPADIEFIDFAELPDTVNEVLQLGGVRTCVIGKSADRFFRQALAPEQLPTYHCLYNSHLPGQPR
jgi:hypothetical protein